MGTKSIHPARALPYADLRAGMAEMVAAGHVTESTDGDGLRLYCYSRSCAYDRQWNPFTLMARGLIIDPARGRVVATPFPKFFNVVERAEPIPDMAFETFEKLDGSLIILFNVAGEWRTATKGSFWSDQARWAAEWLAGRDLGRLDKDATYLAEAIYPDNRIVIHYQDAALVMLAAYDGDGNELPYGDVCAVADSLGTRAAERFSFDSISDLLTRAQTLHADEEGWVLRFADGLRLKIKGDEYRRIHALISRLTPLAMWEAMEAGDDLDKIRRDLPEEFWSDFDQITAIINRKVTGIIEAVEETCDCISSLSDKDVGLQLATFPEPIRHFIFPYRKGGGDLLSGRARKALFREIRPTGNQLDGYVPSYAVGRVLEESA